jgi:hypothetical protein
MPPKTPIPPALVTAAASSGPAATFILGKSLALFGNRIELDIPCKQHRVLDAKELRNGCCDSSHHSECWREEM